jgi:flavin-dependent thymidylate synthase
MKNQPNKVELIGFYGSDETIALSAWTSTSRDLSDDKRQRIPALVRRLWLDSHETPFEKVQLHFLVTCDIASHIHLLKHRISSLNAESARYKELKDDKYYIPEDWTNIAVNKQDNLTLRYWNNRLIESTEFIIGLYHTALEDLTPILGRKRAKETARYFLPYNTQITSDVMFNLRSFANFFQLRSSEHAQVEIRQIAQQMFDLAQNIEGQPLKSALHAIKERIEIRSQYP